MVYPLHHSQNLGFLKLEVTLQVTQECFLCVKHFNRPLTYETLFIHYKANMQKENVTSIFKIIELRFR